MRTTLCRALGILRTSKRRAGPSAFEDFAGTWAEAQAAVKGYASADIIDRVLQASLAVHEGKAVHERDSVNFDRIHYSWPVLAGLLWSAADHGGPLRVVDVGGSLGTSYRQNRKFLSRMREVSWAVVEQPSFVTAGRRHFEDEVLTFHETVEEAQQTRPSVALLASSLQYLEDAAGTLASITRIDVSTLILERTPVHDGVADLLTIQHVPPSIYEATYPAWIFSRGLLLERLRELGWVFVEEFAAPEPPMVTSGGTRFSWTGLIVRRG